MKCFLKHGRATKDTHLTLKDKRLILEVRAKTLGMDEIPSTPLRVNSPTTSPIESGCSNADFAQIFDLQTKSSILEKLQKSKISYFSGPVELFISS
jgi:hypothetical protein